ncbi:hypothetical protein [Thiobacillus sp.]|uniref:hypothetical protein n=1 Tax=Thiobacillus sp. TaxID=924 RepID=UPI0025FA0DE7|nr:hypothetical protein [Thiobacillus sp.]MBT9540841.1 hypothetical protein [Thiobacillus sp.]
MKKLYSVVCAAVLSLSASVASADSATLPSKVVIDSITGGATVTAVDKANRTFTLTAKDGKAHTFTAGPEMVNFDQINAGDKVVSTYAQEMSISVNKMGGAPKVEEKERVVRAAKGDKPSIIVANSTEVTGVVTAIDQKARTVTLKGPQGKEATFPVKEGVKGFSNMAKGDNVVISYTEALSIAVVAPTPAGKKK